MDKKWLWPFMIMFILLIVSLAGFWWKYAELQRGYEARFEEAKNGEGGKQLNKVQKAYDIISSNYVDPVDKKKLTEGAIKGMLAELKDPYSIYMDEETSSQFEQTLDSSFQGIGAEISVMDGEFVIVSPFKNSPAEKAGLKPGDVIVKVDKKAVDGLELYDVVSLIRGKKGSKVEVEIKRKGVDHSVTFNVVRDEIPVDTVHSKLKKIHDKKMGYIQVTSFSEHTAEDFKKAVSKLEDKGMEGLLIDVRGNPGGLLTSVEEMLRLFVTDEKPYIQIQERSGKKNEFYSTLKKEKEYPIAILTDGGSASASEIFAGAMNEAEGYPIIGEKTFGKGTVQQPVPMGDGSHIKLTFFKWLTPNGTWVHKKGIKPTMEISQPDYFHLQPIVVTSTLKQDMNNKQIKVVQKMLDGIGFAPGRTDGYYNEMTKKAVQAFQRINHLKPTGEVDKKTAGKLQEAVTKKIKDEKQDKQLQTGYSWLASQ